MQWKDDLVYIPFPLHHTHNVSAQCVLGRIWITVWFQTTLLSSNLPELFLRRFYDRLTAIFLYTVSRRHFYSIVILLQEYWIHNHVLLVSSKKCFLSVDLKDSTEAQLRINVIGEGVPYARGCSICKGLLPNDRDDLGSTKSALLAERRK